MSDPKTRDISLPFCLMTFAGLQLLSSVNRTLALVTAFIMLVGCFWALWLAGKED